MGPKLYFEVCQFTRSFCVEGAVARAQNLAVAEHDLHAAGEPEVIEIGRVARTLVEGIPDHPALRRAGGHVEHELVAATDQLVVHRLIADARLHDCEAEPLIDLKDAVHPVSEIDDDLARLRCRAAPEPDIVAGADRIERHGVLVRHPHDRLHVGGRGRIDHTGRLRSPPGMVFSA